MEKHDLSPRGISLLLLVISALIPFFIIIPDDFPYLGLSIALAAISSLVFSFVQKDRYTLLLYLSSLALSIFTVLRANPFITFLNIVALLYCNALMIRYQQSENLSVFSIVFSPVTIFFKSLFTKNETYKVDLYGITSKKGHAITEYLAHNIAALGITTIVLLAIVPLLSSANPFFSKLVQDIISVFSLEKFFEFLKTANGLMYALRIITFFVLFVFLPRLVTFIGLQKHTLHLPHSATSSLNVFIPKVAVMAVLFIFFVTQLQLYFSTEQTLEVLGYTHSQYAREVFGQLTLVTLIVFGLLYIDKSNSRSSCILTYILSIQALFLTLIAFKSDYDYSSTWGFTYKRLWGFAGVMWTFGLFSLFIIHQALNKTRALFLKQATILTFATLLGINVVNFDYVIYHYAKTTLPTGTDHYYLSRLTPDAYSYADHLPRLMETIKNTEGDETVRRESIHAAQNITYDLKRLREKYGNLHIFAYNHAEFVTLQESNHLPLDDYQKSISEEYDAIYAMPPVPQPVVIIEEEN